MNDVVQAVLIFIGGTILTILTFQEVEAWEAVKEVSPARSLQLILPADDPVMPWPGLLTGVLIIGVYFWCTNQFVIQRAIAAKSLDHGRWGALFAGLLKRDRPGTRIIVCFRWPGSHYSDNCRLLVVTPFSLSVGPVGAGRGGGNKRSCPSPQGVKKEKPTLNNQAFNPIFRSPIPAFEM